MFGYEDELQGQIDDLNKEIQKLKVHSQLLKEIFDMTKGAWDDPVISEDLYNRMEAAVSPKP